MAISIIQGVSYAQNSDGSVAIEFLYQGSLFSKNWTSRASMVEEGAGGIDSPEAAAKLLASAWCAIDGCTDFNEVMNKDIFVHTGQDLQGGGNADLHQLWKRGGPA